MNSFLHLSPRVSSCFVGNLIFPFGCLLGIWNLSWQTPDFYSPLISLLFLPSYPSQWMATLCLGEKPKCHPWLLLLIPYVIQEQISIALFSKYIQNLTIYHHLHRHHSSLSYHHVSSGSLPWLTWSQFPHLLRSQNLSWVMSLLFSGSSLTDVDLEDPACSSALMPLRFLLLVFLLLTLLKFHWLLCFSLKKQGSFWPQALYSWLIS